MIPEKLSENGYVLINRENIAKEVEKITDSMGRKRGMSESRLAEAIKELILPHLQEQLHLGDSILDGVQWNVQILKRDEQYRFRRDVLCV